MIYSRFTVWLLAAFFLSGAVSAYGKSASVTRVVTTVSPSQPTPGSPYTVKSILYGSTGSPCSAQVSATVAGITRTFPGQVRVHQGQTASLSFTFSLAGIADGTDLTPRISWSGSCGSGSTSAIAGGSTPPTVQPQPTPALGVSKSLSGADLTIVSPGDVVTYQLDFTSTGTDTATAVTLTDDLDSDLVFLSATGGGTHSGGTVRWNFGDLVPGDTNSVEVTVRVSANAASGTIDNTARISAANVAEVSSNAVTITVDTDPNIRLTKTIDDDTTQAAVLEAGRVITYRIRYENLGGGDAADVTVTDVLPAELIGPPQLAGGVSSSYEAATRTATWNLGTVARKGSGLVTLSAQIDPALGKTDFENSARATFTGGTSNEARAHITVDAEPYIELFKNARPTLVAPGDTVTYTIIYLNTGSLVADNPILKDRLPVGITPVPGSYTGNYDSTTRTLEWSLPDLAPGAQVHGVSYQVTVDAGLPDGDLVNQVTMTADNLPGVLTATASTKVQVLEEAVLFPSKVLAGDAKSIVADGEGVTYEIVVANDGKEPTDGGITITDTLPPGLKFVSASAGGRETATGSGVVVWNLADIAANSQSGTVRLEVEVDGSQLADGDFIANAVSVSARDKGGRQYLESSSHAVVQYNGPPSVKMLKLASPRDTTPVFPGDVIEYTLFAGLESLQGITDLEIVDYLPPELEFIKSSDPNVVVTTTPTGTRVEWPEAALNAGARFVTLQARVKSGVNPGESIINLAGATFAAGSGFATPALVRHVVSEAAIELSKSRPADQAEVIDGEEITYTIKYTNTGKVTLTGLKLQDTLPAGLTYVDASPVPDGIVSGPPTTLQWDLPTLEPGKANSVVVRARVNGAASGDVLKNQAQIESNEAQPKTAETTSVVREAPVLVLRKTASADTVHPGDSVEFTVSYENQGRGEAINVVLSDTFPAQLDFVSASDQATPSSGIVSWNLGTLAPGAKGSKTIRATVPPGNYVPALDVTNRADIVSSKTSATASKTVSITELPAFTVLKTVDRDHAAPGDTVHYTLQVDKTGGTATDVFVADLLSPNARYVSGSSSRPLSALSDVANGFLAWDIGAIPAGADALTLTFSAELAPVIDNGTWVNNQAVAGAAEINAVLSNAVTTLVDSQPVLTVAKTASVAVLDSPTTASGEPGGTITYTITAENTGNAVARDVTITDTLPAQLTIDPASTTAAVNGQTATWTVPTLAPGAPASFTITGQVANDLPDGTVLRNTAQIQIAMPGVGGSDSVPVNTPVTGQAVIELDKQASASSVNPGEQLTYTLTYRNVGTARSDAITIEDLVPPETRFVAASNGGADSGNGYVTWSLPALDPNQQGSVTLTLEVAPVVSDKTPLRNVAQAWQGGDKQNAVQATTLGKVPLVSSKPLLEIEKTVENGDTTVTAGGDVVFDITYRNVGGDEATDVVVTDTLPPGLSFVSATGSPAISGNSLTWTQPALAAKTSGNLKVTARADSLLADGKVLTNSAGITARELPLPVSDNASVTLLNAVLTLVKTADRASVQSGVSATNTPGGLLTYTLEYANKGDSVAADTVIRDVLPPQVTLESATPAPASVVGNTVTWAIGNVPVKGAGKVGLVVRVGDDLPASTVLHNTASISSDTVPSTAAPPVDTPVTSEPILTITKSSTVSQVTPGQSYAYDLTVENVGSDVARKVVITDVLPTETGFVGATGGGVESGGTVTWDIGSDHGPITPSSSVTVHVTVRANDPLADGTPLLNIASVTGETRSGAALPPVSSTLLLPVTSSPVLQIDYSVDQPIVQAGGALLYTLRIRNVGNDIARDVVVSASLPPDGTPELIDSGGAFVGDSAVWTIGSLPPAGSIELNFGAFIVQGVTDGKAEGSVAAVSASNAPTASASVLSYVGSRPILELTKSGPASVNAGSPVTYAIDYFNAGNAVANVAVISDILPPGTVFNSASAGGREVSSGVVEWDIGTLAPLAGGRVTVTVDTVVGVHDGTTIANIASIGAANASSAFAQATTTERSHTELEVRIAVDRDPVPAGGQQTFTVSWTNTGNQSTTDALVTATLPASTQFASATGNGNFNGTDLVSWTVGSLPAGASGSATFNVDVDSPLPNGTILKSIASITAADGLPNSQAVPFMVSSTPVLVTSKSASPASVVSGEVVTFTISLQNVGNDDATGVVVDDPLPAGFQLLSADNGATVDLDTNTATWTLGTVTPGAPPLTLSIEAKAQFVDETVTNVAELVSNELPAVSVSASVAIDLPPAVPVPATHWVWLLVLVMAFVGIVSRRLGVTQGRGR